jgi:hypothetical protein
MSDNEVSKFDPSKLMDGVRERIKATFVGLIPDEEWEILVKKEVDAFFSEELIYVDFNQLYNQALLKRKQNYNSYDLKKEVDLRVGGSMFRQIIWNYCRDKTLQVMTDKVISDYLTDSYENGKQSISEEMKKVIENAAPGALLKIIESISKVQMDMMSVNLRNQLQQFR